MKYLCTATSIKIFQNCIQLEAENCDIIERRGSAEVLFCLSVLNSNLDYFDAKFYTRNYKGSNVIK